MDEKSIMLNFLDTIKEISSLRPNLVNVQKLQVQLRCLSNCLIQENYAQLLMECILKYIDFIINVSSSKGFRDQINICRNSFSIITEIILEQVQTTFVKTVTKRVFDIIIEDDVKSWCIKKELLKAYISCIQRTDKNIRQETVHELPNIYLFKMVDSISTYGDYDLQVTLIETVFRMYGKSTITSKLKDLIPESQQLSESFAEINGDTFDEDVRNFLNALNETSGKVFSVICKSVYLGNIKCGEPMGKSENNISKLFKNRMCNVSLSPVRKINIISDIVIKPYEANANKDNVNGLWVDFNLSENAITWYCNKNSFSDNKMDTEDLDESNDKVWNLITLFASDVESVQIHRSVKSEDVLVFFKLKESCISSFDDNQAIIGAANNLKLVVSYNSKKIASLLSKVLPYLFKNKFFHNSSKVSSNKKSVYKPLNVTVSRKAKSDSSKTKSDTSFVTFFDPISGKSSKSDLSTTLKDDISLCKGCNMSSVSSKCEVISIPDSSPTAAEQSLELVPIKDQIAFKSIDSEYETVEMCPNGHFEINPKVSKNSHDICMINTNKLVDIKISKAKIDNSLFTHSSFNDELLNVQEDIERIQILSRRCSSSNVRYSQLSKNSRLATSTFKKLSNFSCSEDRIIKNYIYSSQSKENIMKWSKLITEESSTPNFQTAADENGQSLTNATKKSKSTDVLSEAEIRRENMLYESFTQNFETAENQISDETVKMSTPNDVLLQQYAFSRNFETAVDNILNLNKSNEMNKSNYMLVETSDVVTESLKNRATDDKKLHVKSDVCNFTQEILHPKNTIEVDVENAIVDNSLIKKRDLALIAEEFNAISFPKDNQRSALPNDKKNSISVVQDAQDILTSVNISKSVYSGRNKTEIKQIRKRKNPTLNLNKKNDETIAKLDVSHADSVNTNEHTLVVESMEINSKSDKTHIKCSTATNLCPTKKKKQRHKIKFDKSNKVIIQDSNKENLEKINCLHKIDSSIEQSLNKIKRETELKKKTKSMELLPLTLNKVQDFVCQKLVKIDIKGESNQNSLPKQLMVVEDYRTVSQGTVINVKEQIYSKKKSLETTVTNNSKEKKNPDILDNEVSNKKGLIIQHTKSVGQEDVQTVNDLLIRSIDKNLNENQISNNVNLKVFANEADFKNSHRFLTCDNISSEDEIPLKQLVEKWKRDKFNREFEEIKSNITDNCEKTFIDLQKEIVTKHVEHIEMEKIKSQLANFDNENVISKQGETLKPFIKLLENFQKPVNIETIKELNNKPEFNKGLDNLSKISMNGVYDTDMGNNKEKKKSNEEIIKIKTDLNKNKTQMSEKNYNESVTINKIDVTKDFNRTVSTLGPKKKRKLYNPEDLTYLEDSILEDLSTKLVQIKSPIQLNEEGAGINNLKKTKRPNDIVVSLHDCNNKIKRSCKGSRTLKIPIQLDGNNFELNNFNKFEKTNDTVVPLNDCDIKRSYKRTKTPKELKVVNPNTMLKVFNNKNKCYSHLRPVFYNMLESFRKEVATSFVEILEEPTPKKEKTKKNNHIKNMTKTNKFVKNRSIIIDMDARLQKPSASFSSSDLSLNLKNEICMNGNSYVTPPLATNSNCSLPKLYIEKNNHKKINIISDIQIRPKRMLFEDNTEKPKKKIKTGKLILKSNFPQETTKIKNVIEPVQTRKVKHEAIVPLNIMGETQLPIISESITHEEINSWIVTGSPKYSQFSEKRYVLKHTYPMFESLLTLQDSSQEYKDVLKIFNILKKYC